MNIPDQAVQAAAKYLSDLMADPDGDYTMEARDLIRTAEPHIAAAAWDEGWQACVNFSTYPEIDGEPTVSENPYRSQA